jgi:(1->4)-alpha-D-glucan 1-alpha-D-glucosylmutase
VRSLRDRGWFIHAPGPDNGGDYPLYLIVEKILASDEQLPPNWPVHGTTGYNFAALVDVLVVDPDGEVPLDRCYRDFADEARPLAEEICAAKRLVMRNLFSSELHVLASELSRIAESDPPTRDYTLDALHDALAQVVVCFPVYRTYISEEGASAMT